MQGDYRLMKDDVELGIMTIDRDKDIWEYNMTGSLEAQPLLFKMVLGRNPGSSFIEGKAVREWLLVRAPESNYTFIDALMERVGITEYDPLAFVKYNEGRFNTDQFYLEPVTK